MICHQKKKADRKKTRRRLRSSLFCFLIEGKILSFFVIGISVAFLRKVNGRKHIRRCASEQCEQL